MLRLFVAAAAFALAAPLPADAQTLDKIRKSGVITLGYIDGAAPFSYTDGNGEAQGYSVDLCRAVAEGVGAQRKRTGLKTRGVKLTRQSLVDFSLMTFVDGGSLLVGADSPIGGIADLEGKRVAVISGTTTERALRAALARRMVKAEAVLIKTRDEGLALLGQGQVDALASDRTADRKS